MAIFYFPNCIFSANLSIGTGTGTNDWHAAFDWNPNSYDVAVAATTNIRMDTNATGNAPTGIFSGAGNLLCNSFALTMFPYYYSQWSPGAVRVLSNTSPNYTGSQTDFGTKYMSTINDKMQLFHTFSENAFRYYYWSFTSFGTPPAVAMVVVGRRHSLAMQQIPKEVGAWNWDDSSNLYSPTSIVYAGNGLDAYLPARSASYMGRQLLFELISPQEFDFLRHGHSICAGPALPFWIMEDDDGDPSLTATMWRFMPDGFAFSQPASELYNVTISIKEVPRIVTEKYPYNGYRRPF